MKKFLIFLFLIFSAILLTSCDPNDGPVDPVYPPYNPPVKKVEVTITVNITYLSDLYRLHNFSLGFFSNKTPLEFESQQYNVPNVNNTAPTQAVNTFSFEGEEAVKLINKEAKAYASIGFRFGNYFWGPIKVYSDPFVIKEGKNEITINVVQPSSPP